MVERKAIVYRSYDPVDLELAEARLRAAEIPYVRVGRGSAALLGVGDAIVEQLLEVDQEHLEHARELLTDTEEDDDDDDEVEDEPARPATATLKQHFMAAGLSLVFPGLGIAYAGLPLAGFALLFWSVSALFMTVAPGQGAAFGVFGQLLPRLVDFAGAQLLLNHFGRRKHPVATQAALAIVLVAVFYLGFRYGGPHVAQLVAE